MKKSQPVALFVFCVLFVACNQKTQAPETKVREASANSESNQSDTQTESSEADAQIESQQTTVPMLPPAFPFYGTWAQCITSNLGKASDNSVKSIKQVDSFKEGGSHIREETYFKDTECKVPFTLADRGKTFNPRRNDGPTGAAQSPNFEKCEQPIDYSLPGSLSVPIHMCIETLMGVTTSEHYFEMMKLEDGKGCFLGGSARATQITPYVFEMRGDKLRIVHGGGYYISKNKEAQPDVGLRTKAMERCEEMLQGDEYELPYYTRVSP